MEASVRPAAAPTAQGLIPPGIASGHASSGSALPGSTPSGRLARAQAVGARHDRFAEGAAPGLSRRDAPAGSWLRRAGRGRGATLGARAALPVLLFASAYLFALVLVLMPKGLLAVLPGALAPPAPVVATVTATDPATDPTLALAAAPPRLSAP